MQGQGFLLAPSFSAQVTFLRTILDFHQQVGALDKFYAMSTSIKSNTASSTFLLIVFNSQCVIWQIVDNLFSKISIWSIRDLTQTPKIKMTIIFATGGNIAIAHRLAHPFDLIRYTSGLVKIKIT
jgi:hypothetical protein